MAAPEVIQCTVGEVTAELMCRGISPDAPVTIIIRPAQEFAAEREEARVRIIVASAAPRAAVF